MKFKKSTISAIILLVALATIIGLSGINFLIPKINNNSRNIKENLSNSLNMEKIFFTTRDNVKIAANLYSVTPEGQRVGWVILSHMMPETKESWDNLAKDLQNSGYESLAIDLRGHGQSTTAQIYAEQTQNGAEIKKLDYHNFSDAEHQKSILDLEAGVDYLIKNRGAVPEKISFIGASIGANLSLQYISEHPEYKSAVLLSPGLNYRGIKTEPLVKNLKVGQKVFFVSAHDDDNNAGENQKLYDLIPTGVEKKIETYEAGGHGTDILKNQPKLKNLIIEFLK